MQKGTLPRLKIAFAVTALGALVACKKGKDEETPQLSINRSTIDMLTSGGEAELTVASNKGWSLSGLPSWVTASASEGTGNATIKLKVDLNNTAAARTASVAFKVTGASDATLAIKQIGLVDWLKGIDNTGSVNLVDAGDGYVIGGNYNDKITFAKLSKDGKTILKTATIGLPVGFTEGNLVSFDTMPGGGYVMVANVAARDNSGSINRKAMHFTKLYTDFSLAKDLVLDYSGNSESATRLRCGKDFFAFCYTDVIGGSAYSYLMTLNYNLDGLVPRTSTIMSISDLEITSDGSILVAGSESSLSTVYKYDNTLRTTGRYEGDLGGAGSILVLNDGYLVAGTKNKGGTDDDIHCFKLGTDMKPITGKELIIDRSKHDRPFSLIALSGGGYAISGSVSVNGELAAYTVRIDKDLAIVPGKELIFDPAVFSQSTGSLPLSDGSYVLGGWKTGAVIVHMNL